VTDRVASHSAAQGVSEPGGSGASTPPRVAAALWSETLQALAAAVAHDLRNALNAVAVNLEVVRVRSARGADAPAIAPFASTAAKSFEKAAVASEALLAFVRAEAGDADVAAIVVRLARLFAVSERRTLDVSERSGGRARTRVPADVVRTAVARSVLAAFSDGDVVACEITVDDGIFLSVTGATRVPPLLDSALVAAVAPYGIRFASRAQSLELHFPAVD
jgi:signal transduction histidine kinase